MLRRGVRKEGDSGFAQHLCSCARRYVPGWRVAKYLVSHDCLWSRQKKKDHNTHYPSCNLPSSLVGKHKERGKWKDAALLSPILLL